MKCDDNKQYHHHLDLRVNNSPLPANSVIESCQDV